MSSAPLFPFLEQLLQGETVVWKKLGEVAELVRGNGLPKKDFTDFGVPAIHYGQIYTYYGNETVNTISFVSEESADKLQKVHTNNIVITNTSENIDDVCKAVLYLGKEDAVTGGHATIIRPSSLLLPKYFVYLTQTENFFAQKKKLAKGTKVIDVSAKDLAQILIPLPSVRVQRRIVEILDKFTNLEAELKAELSLRNKQYAFYRNKLLDFRNPPPPNALNVRWMKLGEVAEIGTGKSNRQDETENGEYPFYVRSQKVLRSSSFQFDETAIIIPGEGGIGEIFHFVEGKYALHQRAYRIKLNNASEICTRFLYYYMRKEFGSFILKRSVGATATSIRKPMIESFPIPIPPLAEQERIVAILDRFDTLTNSIAEGLPREIGLRHQQYVFYRDALLNFPK